MTGWHYIEADLRERSGLKRWEIHLWRLVRLDLDTKLARHAEFNDFLEARQLA